MSIEVHIDWQGATQLVGRLNAAERASSVSFEYASEWLRKNNAFAIDPINLPFRPGVQHGKALFGAVQDCGPDRWGRILIERAVRKKVLAQKPYREIDYVLALDDLARVGALRFKHEPNGPFLAPTSGKLPPLVRLSALARATDAIHSETETTDDLRFLLGAGSPLGGARPKAVVRLSNEQLAMAKFPKPDDTRDIAAGEILALTLAANARIRVAGHQRVTLGKQSAAVITRFDRAGQHRVPFISAATLLSLPQGEEGAYTLLADGIRQFGDNVSADLHELWRRMVFSLLISNHDDHLRNHGFLMFLPGRWSLSPAYDLNPVPEIDRVRMSQTAISEEGEEPSIAAALAVTDRFGLKTSDAREILRQVLKAVSAWRNVGRMLRLSAATLDTYASAFEHPMRTEAATLVAK
jgi:serine/threonine-protein kinase HipA